MIGEAKEGPGTQEVSAESVTVPVVVNRIQPLRNGENGDPVENRRLSPAERRVMRVVCDPANHDKTHRDRAAAAHVSESRYYEIMRDPSFVRIHRETIRTSVNATVGALMNKAVSVALTKDRDGAADRWKLLELSGHYVPRQQTDITSAGQAIIAVSGVDVADV